MTFCVSTGVKTWTNWSSFEPDPDHSPDARTGLRMHCNAEFYYVGKILRTGIGRLWKPRRVVLRRRNTVVGGKGALPSALLVIIWLYLVVQLYKWFPAVILEKGVEIPEVFLASYRLAIFRKSHQSTSHNLKRFRSISEKPGWGGGRLAPSHL